MVDIGGRGSKINNSQTLLNDYQKAVDKGELSALVTFKQYVRARARFDSEIVGITTSKGIIVKGYSKHSIARHFGSIEHRRNGVPIKDIKQALLEAESKNENDTSISIKHYGNKAIVTINPVNGNIIQLNPRTRRR